MEQFLVLILIPYSFRYVVSIVFCAEHFLILCVVLSHFFISDTPHCVKLELDRRDYVKKQLLKELQHKKIT